MKVRSLSFFAAACFVGLCLSAGARAQQTPAAGCGSLENAFGPLDYRKDQKSFVDLPRQHFGPAVENLMSSRAGADIDYVLRAIPNHHRALIAIMRLGEREKTSKPSFSRYTVECWFDRALRFRPDDNVARMIYVTFLTQQNRHDEARGQLKIVDFRADPDNAFTQYNMGMLYFDLGDYDAALTRARKALEMGLNAPDLREKLTAAGKWKDAVSTNSDGTGTPFPAIPQTPSAASSQPATP